MKTVKPAGTLPGCRRGAESSGAPSLPGPGNATAAAQAWPGGGVEGDAAENHKEILQELLSAYFWEKVQARCSPSECRLCPRSSLTRRNLSSLPPLQPDQLTQAPPAAAAAAVGHQTLLLQVPPRPSCSRMPTGCVALVAAIYYHQQQHMADELQS